MTGCSDDTDAARAGEVIHHDWSDGGDPMYALVETLAVATDRELTDVPPLDHYVDTDALQTLLSNGEEPGNRGIEVTFDYDGVSVTVRDDGTMEMRLPPSV